MSAPAWHPARGGMLLVSLSSAWHTATGGWVEVAHRPGRCRVTLRSAQGQASTLAGEADYYAATLDEACGLALMAVQAMQQESP